ncbi:ABC transporter permease [Flavobacterium sp. WV_118_3]|uniref:ABC transporter permease n=1 Tax=Flavobacterium sp. WV_118_3 TaxID=3151764 RepID=UPI00321BEA40
MKSLQQLFRLKNDEVSQQLPDETQTGSRELVRLTHYQRGFGASVKAMGKPIVFKACLQNLYRSFEEQCRKQKVEQEALKQIYREEQERNRSELKKCETTIEIAEAKEKELNETIERTRKDMVEVRQHPEKYGIEGGKGIKVQFYMGLAFLFPITLYLLVFYISACYSAFFKEFDDNSLTAAIFDADALKNAFKASSLEGIFIMTIPFVFMGLGYLIHMLLQEKGKMKWIKIGLLGLVTFLFDVILAYQIEKKIYDFNKTTSSEPYTLKIALFEAEFWLIIFAGFMVYIIWGLVLDSMMKEYESLDKVKTFIKVKKEELVNLEAAKNANTEKLNEGKQQITAINGIIAELQTKIDGFIIPVKEYFYHHHKYKEGWFQAVSAEIALPHREKTLLLELCEIISKEHLNDIGLGEPELQPQIAIET